MGGARGESLLHRYDTREHNRTMPLLALAFGLGVWLAARTDAGLWPLWLLPVAALCAFALKLWGKRLFIACLPLVLMAGLFYAQPFLHPAMPHEGPHGRITATVSGNPMPRDGSRVALMLCNVTLDGKAKPGKAYLTLTEQSGVTADQLFDGAAISFSGTVYHPSAKQNAYDFDFRLWLLQNGIAYGLSGAKDFTVENTCETAPWTDWAARVRALCAERLLALMGPPGNLAVAMLLGERDALAEDELLAFQQAGVMHLMSVSGLHVAILAGALAWLMNRLAARRGVRLAVTAVFVALYCALTGFSPATVRAAAMLLLWLAAQAAGRRADALATLSAAALAVLLLRPLDLFSAGFALSFSAMGGIMVFAPRLRRLLAGGQHTRPPRRRSPVARAGAALWRKTADLLAVSLAAQAGVMLPVAATYHRLPLYGVFFNLLAVPLAGLLVPLYAATLLLSLVPLLGWPLGVALGWVAALGTRLLAGLVGLAAQLPYAQVRVASPTVWAYAVLAAAALAAGGFVRARWSRTVAALALAGLVALGGAWLTHPASLRYHQLAVGQGDAALLMDGDQTVAIDVGDYGGEAAGRLLAEGRDLDALILTHLHSDHALGTARLLSEGIAIRRAYLPIGADAIAPGEEGYDTLSLLAASGVPISYLAAGDRLPFRQASIEALWPQPGGLRAGHTVNDGSLALLIRMGGLRILNMGDVSGLYERYAARACDLLKVGHHGSNSGTLDAFLTVVNPAWAIVTCRSGASLPGDDTMARLSAHGVATLRTDQTGEIMLAKTGGGFTISTYLSPGP